MQTMEFRILSQLVTNKKARNALLVGLAGTVLLGGGSLAWLKATSPPQIVAEAALQCDPAWLLQATPDKDYSREQIRLFLTNRDPSVCNSQGLLWGEVDRESLRMLGEAAVNVRDKKHPCFSQSMAQCLNSFKSNVETEWTKAKTPGDRIKTIARFLAVEASLDAIEGNRQIAAGETGDALFLQLIEKSRLDRTAASSQTPDGIAAEARRQAELEREAQRDAQEGFSFSEPQKPQKGGVTK